MKKTITLFATVIALALLVTGCESADGFLTAANTQGNAASPLVQDAGPHAPNFLLLISDEQNDITDFSELWVTISAIGFVQGNEEGIAEYPLDEPVSVNLATLTGENAVALWGGYLEDGTYTKVFLSVDEAWGIPVGDEESNAVEIKLPSGKLQVNVPVTVDEGDEPTSIEYVFDITVHRAGESGTYVLSPQLSESGAGAKYRLLEQTQDRIMTGKPEWAGNPVDAGRPETAGKDDEQNPGPQVKPDDAGKPDDGGLRTEANKPEWGGDPGKPTETQQGKG